MKHRSFHSSGGMGQAQQLELFDLFHPAGEVSAERSGATSAVPKRSVSSAEAGSGTSNAAVLLEEPTTITPTIQTGSDDEALRALADSMTQRAKEFATRFRLGELAEAVHVVWNQRMRTAAGRAHYGRGKIEMNPRLLTLTNATEEVERTFLHELAHLVAYGRNCGRKIQAHGPEWRRACAELGIPGEGIYHDLPFKGRKIRRKWAYRCPACGKEFERVRRFRQAVACYDCCRSNTWGRYHERYRLVEREL